MYQYVDIFTPFLCSCVDIKKAEQLMVSTFNGCLFKPS
jgi:hypothetical protein